MKRIIALAILAMALMIGVSFATPLSDAQVKKIQQKRSELADVINYHQKQINSLLPQYNQLGRILESYKQTATEVKKELKKKPVKAKKEPKPKVDRGGK